MRPAALAALLLAACTTSSPSTAPDAEVADAEAAGKDAACADNFGDALTDSFGRVDGTVIALVEPGNTRCTAPNSDHVIVQVEMTGAIYRMVVNVESSGADPEIKVREATAPLPAPAFADGWHTGVALDYATDLSVHSTDAWDSLPLTDAVVRVADAIEIGAAISVYGSSSGGSYAGSAHLIHRNGGGEDGALVLAPTSAAPRWLLFRFADQSF